MPNGSKVPTMSYLEWHGFGSHLTTDPNWKHEHNIGPLDDGDAEIDVAAINNAVDGEIRHRHVPFLNLSEGGPNSTVHKDLQSLFIEKQYYNAAKLATFTEVFTLIITAVCMGQEITVVIIYA